MGVLKVGAAYLPIDPKYPQERIRYMLEDSKAKYLLAQSEFISTSPITAIDLNDEVLFVNKPVHNPGTLVKAENAACMIYTSGSTGLPKGVVIRHNSLVNFIDWRIQEYRFTAADVIMQLLSFSFDGFGTNFYSSLLSGGV